MHKKTEYFSRWEPLIKLSPNEIKLSFIDKRYTIDRERGVTTCELVCKLNLRRIENTLFKFSNRMRKILLPGIMNTYTVKYNAPKLHYFYQNGKMTHVITDEIVCKDDYFDTFTVSAYATARKDDKFDEKTGKILSEAIAKKKAYRKARKMMTRLANVFWNLAEYFDGMRGSFEEYARSENNRFLRFATINDDKENVKANEPVSEGTLSDDISSDVDLVGEFYGKKK
jgi:hypothetical protein